MEENQQTGSDCEFVGVLREAVDGYFRAVDAWESAYRKYYRLPGYAGKITADLENEHRGYLESRRSLESLLPRARRLSYKYGLRDPWTTLLRIDLGRYAPQERDSSAIGRTERTAVHDCLIQMQAASSGWDNAAPAPRPEMYPSEDESRSWLRRLVDFFY